MRLGDAVAVEQDVEPVDRARVVLEPVGEADLRLGRLVADRREVDAVRELLHARLVADLVQHRGEVLDDRLGRIRVDAVDDHLLTRGAGLLHQLLRLRDVVCVGRDLLVLGIVRRQDVLRRLGEPAEELEHRVPVDRVVHRLARLQLVERRHA